MASPSGETMRLNYHSVKDIVGRNLYGDIGDDVVDEVDFYLLEPVERSVTDRVWNVVWSHISWSLR